MDVSDITRRINQNIRDQVPVLKGTLLETDPAADLVRSVIDPRRFEITNPEIESEDTAVHVHGTARFLGVDGITVNVGYRLVEGSNYFSVTATLSDLTVFRALKLSNDPVELQWDYGPLGDDANRALPISLYRYRATLPIGSTKIPVTIRPPSDTDAWQLESDLSEAIRLPGLQPLLEWLPGKGAAQIVPPALRSLSGLGIGAVSMAFDPQAGVINSARISLELNQAVPLIPGNKQLALLNGVLTVGFERDADGKIDLQAVAYGDLKLGDAYLSVRVGFDAGRKSTTLQLVSQNFMLPSLTDLATVVGGARLLQPIPPGFRNLKSLRLKELGFEIAASGTFDARIALDCLDAIDVTDDVTLEAANLTLAMNAGEANALTATFDGLLRVGIDYVSIRGELNRTVCFSGYVAEIQLGELIAAYVTKLPKGLQSFALKGVCLHFDGQRIDFDCSSEVPVGELASALGMPLPDGLPVDIKLSTVHVGVAFAPNAEVSLEVHAELSPPATFPQGSPTSLEIRSVRIAWSSISGTAGGVQLAGQLSLGDDVKFTVPTLALGYQDGAWRGEAAVNAQVYGQSVTGFVANIKDKTFQIERKAGKPLPLISATNVATCLISTFSVSVARTNDEESVSDWEFNLAGGGDLTIGPQNTWGFKTAFDVKIEDKSLRLEATDLTQIHVPVGPQGVAELIIDFHKLGIEFSQAWSIVGSGTALLNNLPDVVKDYYPSKLPDITLSAGKTGVSVACNLAESKLAPEITLFKVGKKAMSPRLKINEVKIDLSKTPSIASIIHVDRLKDLNYIFGKQDDGSPKVDFLNDAFDLRLTLAKKIQLQLESGSPLKRLKLQKDPETGDQFFVWNLGRGLNRFKVTMPKLEWGGGAWAGSGGLEIMDGKSLLLPLQPLKFVLRSLDLKAVADAIPPSVPIDIFDISKPFRDVLVAGSSKGKIDKLYKDETAGAILKKFDDTVWTPLQKIRGKMPLAFRPYTSLPDLQKIRFSLAATPGGGWSGGLSLAASDGGSVRFMLPFFGGMMPELIGFNLKSFELGQAVGGLATFRVNGAIDRFDLVTLVVAASNAATKLLPQADIDNLRDHLELSNVFGATFVGFPVPIPILYDKISWDYKNWWGLEGKSNWKLQLGEDVDIWTMLDALLPFFMQKRYRMVENREGDAFRLNFAAGPNYLKLPSYLGVKKPLGTTAAGPTLPADVSVRWILDACKFVNPGYAIRSIPLQNPQTKKYIRVGTEKVVFGPLEIDVGWCITTEEEFKQDKQVAQYFSAMDATKTLKYLPKNKPGVTYDKGFIVVLAGSANLAGVLEYRAQFGNAVTSTGGFESRIFMKGGITNVVTLAIDGGIHVERDGSTQIDSGCDLRIAGLSVLQTHGCIKVTSDSFYIHCKFTFAESVSIGGKLYIGNDGVFVAIEGGVWQYAAGKKVEAGAEASARFSAEGMVLRLEGKRIYGTNCSLNIYIDKRGKPGVLVEVDVSELNKLFLQDIGKALGEVREEINKQNPGFKALIEKNIKNVNSFDDIRRGLPKFLTTIKSSVQKTVSTHAGKYYDGLGWKKKAALNAAFGGVSGGRKKLQRRAVKEANTFLKPIDTLKKNLASIERQKIADQQVRVAKTKEAISKALTDVINLNGTKKTIKVLGYPVKNIPIKFDTRGLKQLQNLLNTLPNDFSNADKEKARIAKTIAGRTANELETIANNIEKRVMDQIPQLQSITVDTFLDGLKGPNVVVTVTIKQGSVTKITKPEMDLMNPAKSIRSITDSFVKTLAR